MRVSRDRSGRLFRPERTGAAAEPTQRPAISARQDFKQRAEAVVISIKLGSVSDFIEDNGFRPGRRNANEEMERWMNR